MDGVNYPPLDRLNHDRSRWIAFDCQRQNFPEQAQKRNRLLLRLAPEISNQTIRPARLITSFKDRLFERSGNLVRRTLRSALAYRRFPKWLRPDWFSGRHRCFYDGQFPYVCKGLLRGGHV